MKRIDLHIHTNFSDGTLSPKEVIDEAVKNGVSVIAISDHDTIDAYDEDLYNYAKSNGIEIINAVEISTKNHKVGIHVLGYNFDMHNEEFRRKLTLLRNARHDYLHNVAEKLKELGYILNVEELDKIEAVTKSHISLDVISNPSNREILLQNFNHIPNKGEFIETVMNEGCPAYVKKETVTPKEAAELIRQAGGKAILAHPVAYEHEDNLTDEDILQIVKDMNADGIEANYIYVDSNNEKFDEIAKWNDFAIKHKLIVTMGSDFHNKDGIRPEIGFINENLDIKEHVMDGIVNNLKR